MLNPCPCPCALDADAGAKNVGEIGELGTDEPPPEDEAIGLGTSSSRNNSSDACRIVSRYAGGTDTGALRPGAGAGDVALRARVAAVAVC